MRTKELTKTAVMAALVFVAIYVLKIPGPNGYSHLGDCMILISVLLLGGKKGAWAGGIGAALADLLGGYMQWVLPTFLIKAVMALIMGYVIDKWHHSLNWLAGAMLGAFPDHRLHSREDFLLRLRHRHGYDTRASGTDSFWSCINFHIRGCSGHHRHFKESKGDVEI